MERKQDRNEMGVGGTRLRAGMTFLSENPEAFGYLSDACPVATSELLIAANGRGMADGEAFPMHAVEMAGVDGLFDEVFGGLIHRTDENARLLAMSFGEEGELQEHPVSRYCAVLAEAVALQILEGPAKGASYEQTGSLLGNELTAKLARLRETVADPLPSFRDAGFYTVSLGVCRIEFRGEGNYGLEIFAAGDFRVFLLDGEGLHPLWMTDTPPLSPDVVVMPSGRRLTLHHPEPFAILLLSDSLCALSTTEERALPENPGMIWRYRMRLEHQLLRLITACVREQEFGDRAARFFTGRSRGRDSASGAMAILRDGVSYEVFRSVCGQRLTKLEEMISLMPEGYDPDRVAKQQERVEEEEAHLRRILRQEKGISDRVAEALRCCALEKLRSEKEGDVCPPPSGVPHYRRLTREEVECVYRRYDGENARDRARIEENRRALRENLTDHWIALRPGFLASSGSAERAECARSYEVCVAMKSRLSRMLTARQRTLTAVETLLSDSLAVLRSDGKDWLEGRAGDGCITSWARRLEGELSPALSPILTAWEKDSEAYRSLMAAYTYERELLFRMDTHPEHGFFHADWRGIADGALSDGRWESLLGSLEESSPYRTLVETLRRVSLGNGALLERIEGRGAERRMARELAGRPELQIAALRASAYEDADWGESVLALMTPSLRREHLDVVRHWQETRELNARREKAYGEYVGSYSRYIEEL